MCDKPNPLKVEAKWVGYFRKDNQPPDATKDQFIVYLRPCLCGEGVVGRVDGGTVYAVVEEVVI